MALSNWSLLIVKTWPLSTGLMLIVGLMPNMNHITVQSKYTWIDTDQSLSIYNWHWSKCVYYPGQTAAGCRHDDVIKWKHFLHYWPFVQGIYRWLEFPTQRPVTRNFDAFFDLRLNEWLSKQSWGWWFEMPSCPLWRHSNGSNINIQRQAERWLDDTEEWTEELYTLHNTFHYKGEAKK